MSLLTMSGLGVAPLRLSPAMPNAKNALAAAVLTCSLLIGPMTSATAQVFNPDNGHFYEIVNGPIRWTDANAAAQTLSFGTSGYLATVTSQEENDFIVANLGGHPALDGRWLGGFQNPDAPDFSEPGGGWSWVTGEAWDYTAWFRGGEPNNFGGNEHFLAYEHAAGKWNDLANVLRAGYVVEYDATGLSQVNPILPDIIAGNTFFFEEVGSGLWFDPAPASRFDFQITNGSLFTEIVNFPTGFASPFTVSVGGNVLGQFAPGQSVDFTALFTGGVSSFSISGINPAVTVGNPTAFPIQLAFDTPTASFSMTAVNDVANVPEPGAVAFGILSAGTVIGLIARKRKA